MKKELDPLVKRSLDVFKALKKERGTVRQPEKDWESTQYEEQKKEPPRRKG
jgi:hypothetical protein